MTFILVNYMVFIFSRQLLKLILLLENFPEFIHTAIGVWISHADEKGSLVLQYRKPHEPGISPSSGPDLPFFSLWRLAAHTCKWLILLSCSTQAQGSAFLSFLYLASEAEDCSVAKGKRGYAFAITQAGSVQQRTCSTLSPSSQLPV